MKIQKSTCKSQRYFNLSLSQVWNQSIMATLYSSKVYQYFKNPRPNKLV